MALPKHRTGLPCVKCGAPQRMMSSSGTELTMCETCQRAYWAASKRQVYAAKPRSTEKTCTQCGQTLPLEDFPANGNYRKNTCKTCYSQQVSVAKTARRANLKYDPNETERECNVCHQVLPIAEFRLNKGRPIRACRTCYDQKQRETRQQKAKPAVPPDIHRQYPTTATPDQRRTIKPPMLFVDRQNQRVILGVVESETPLNERTLTHVIGVYRRLGYRIIETVEQIEELTEKAGD